MKLEPDIEMEQLLRAHAGSGAAKSASAAEAARGPLPDEEHLDADELSAFAENALSPAARARYTIHLADCDRCRGIVAGLSSAANIAGALEQSSQTVSVPTTNLNDKQRGWLANLFSLSGLRFALPVLAFMVIGGIVWRAYEVPRADRSKAELRSTAAIKSEQQDVEQSETSTTAQTASAPASAPEVTDNKKRGNEQSKKATENVSGPTGNSGSGNETQSSSFSPVPAAPPPSLTARQDQAAAPPQQDGEANKQKETRDERSAAGVAEEKVEVANSAAQPSAEKARSDEPRGAAASPAAAPRRQAPGKPVEADDKLASSDSAMRQREAPKTSAAGAGGAQKDEAKNRVMKAQRAAIADEAEAAKSSETRIVGGRQFQRRGGVWTDTTYVSGSATVNIKRGSEQYRALVADEPTLRAISERLSGEVIVIWKGHAYRFR